MSHFGVACGHFQLSVNAQGADSVLAGNGPFQRKADRESPSLSPRCAQIRRAFAQVIHRFVNRQALACRGASREIPAPLPGTRTAARTVHTHDGSLPPPQGKEGTVRDARLLQDDDPATTCRSDYPSRRQGGETMT